MSNVNITDREISEMNLDALYGTILEEMKSIILADTLYPLVKINNIKNLFKEVIKRESK